MRGIVVFCAAFWAALILTGIVCYQWGKAAGMRAAVEFRINDSSYIDDWNAITKTAIQQRIENAVLCYTDTIYVEKK